MACLTELYDAFIVNGVKIVSTNIYDLLSPIALAQWIMGDGVNDHGFGLILCTDSYSLEDIIRLVNVLMINDRLDCNLRKHGKNNRIYIKKKSMLLLRSVVISYFHSSMKLQLQKVIS